MRRTVAISAVVLVIGSAVIAHALTTSGATPPPEPPGPSTGIELLQAHACGRGETKRILVRGMEDGFSPAGEEPGFIRPGRQNPSTTSFFSDNKYDQYLPDRRMTDSFEVPSRIAGGLFVISLRKVAANGNDSLSIGDTPRPDGRSRFSSRIGKLEALPGWRRAGSVYSARIDAIRIAPDIGKADEGRTLLDFIRAGGSATWVDINVEDDTSVDFMGMTVCEQPAGGKGLTLSELDHLKPRMPGTITLTCQHGSRSQYVCDAYQGDTPCDRRLPVACFRPGDAPHPKDLVGRPGSRTWSGGALAVTEPVAASRFATIGDVDRFCSRRFGPEWRTAALHDGVYWGITAYGDPHTIRSRVWVDIAEQPYATCWSR